MIFFCDTLDQFLKLVQERNFKIERTALYYRLQPVRANSIASQRHVSTRTIPVRLFKPQDDDQHHPSNDYT